MAIIKCKMCGGDIQLAEDKTFGTCEYCGSTMTLPKVSDDQRAAAFNRGNHFRRIGEFDKALAVYERIVAEDDNDAEAHWCCALCRFGIEYVEDPATYEWLPTCHRASFDSFLEDVDYIAALEHSDGITRRQYQKDAAKIAEVQRGILATSQNTEPYDVFISYKELDADGNRTRDSILAQELYYRLTEKGWRVFFSRISLEDVPGTQYEPYIFAALNSAKVMIVVGTSAENLNAVWVKNEWSRYLSLMRKDRSKLLIPCYRDMDPYDLPEQLSVLMSYDMGKIGFIQDLIRGVDKVLAAEKPKETKKTDPAQAQPMYVSNEADAKTAAAVKRGNLALEESDWSRARDYFEQALTFDAESAEAYFGMALAENECRSAEDYIERAVSQTPERKTLTISLAEEHIRDVVGKCEIPMFISTGEIKSYYNAFNPLYRSAADGQRTILEKEKKNFENNRNIVLAFRFAKGKYRETLENVRNALYSALEDNVRVAEQEEHEAARQKEEKYQEFLQKKDLEVEELYQKKLAERENVYLGLCKEFENANESYRFRTLKERFQFLGDYKDCEEYVRRCGERAAELEKKERAEQEEQRKEKLYTTYHKVFDAPEPKTIRQNEWETAKQGFESLGEYRDAPACAQKCVERIEQIKREEAAKAKAAAEEAERQRILAEKATAEKKARQKRIEIIATVISVLAIAATVVVTKVIIPNNNYKTAKDLYEAGKYEEAAAAFENLGEYKDSADRFNEAWYHQAEVWLDEGRYAEAAIGFGKIGSYQDARERSFAVWDRVAHRDTIAVGYHHTVGLRTDGTVVAAGKSRYGDYEQCNVSSWTNIIAVAAGGYHTVGLKADGTVVVAGTNSDVERDVSEWTNIVAIAAGPSHTVGLKADGTVVAAGTNSYGECNVSEWTDVVAIAAGGTAVSTSFTVGLKKDGTVVTTWNDENDGFDLSNWADIVAVAAGGRVTIGMWPNGTVCEKTGGISVEVATDAKAIAAGFSHTVVLKVDGTVVTNGNNKYGERSVSGWENIVAVAAGGWNTMGLKADGTVIAVGLNEDNQCNVSGWRNIKLPNE